MNDVENTLGSTEEKVIYWPVEEGLLESPAVSNRDLFARKYQDESPDEILKRYAFFDTREIEQFYRQVFALLPELELSGVGVELGAGTAGFSSVSVKCFQDIQTLYALEVVPEVVRLLQPRIIGSLCGGLEAKIKNVVGSFDQIDLPDDSVDFCIEVESLHHSDDLRRTVEEAARVLKPGGVLLLLDRAHHDGLTDEQRQLMLDIEYSDEWKIANGYAMDRLNRAENGEHEIRLCEWQDCLADAGFSIDKRIELRTFSFKKLLRAMLLCLPFSIRKRLNLLPSRVRPQKGELSWMFRKLVGLGKSDPVYHESMRDYTIMLTRYSA